MFPANPLCLYRIVRCLGVLGCALLVPIKSSKAEEPIKSTTEPAKKDAVRISTTQVRVVFDFYEALTRRKLKISPDVPLNIEVPINFDGPRDEAIKVMRQALLAKGIELRDTETETLVTYTPVKSPSTAPNTPSPAPPSVAPEPTPGRKKIRPIDPPASN